MAELSPTAQAALTDHPITPPPSLKEQALKELDAAILRGDCLSTSPAKDIIRRALEQLDD